MKKKMFSLLALLIMAVSGAWADSFSTDPYEANATLNNVTVSADNMEITINKGVTVTVNNGVSIQNGATLTVNGPGTLVVYGAAGNPAVSGSIIVNGATVQATGGQGNQGSTGSVGDYSEFFHPGNGGDGGQGGVGGAAFSGAVTIYKGQVIATGGRGGTGGTGGTGGNTGNFTINLTGGDKGGIGGNGGTGGTGGVAFASTLTVYGGNVNAIGGAAGAGGSRGAGGKNDYNDTNQAPSGSPGQGGSAGKAFSTASVNLEVEEAKMYSDAAYTSAISSVTGQTKVYIIAPPAFDYKLTVNKTNAHGSVVFTVETKEEELVTPANSANKDDSVAFTITPDDGYVVANVSAKPYTTWDAHRRAPGAIDINNNVVLTPVSEKENTWTFAMPEFNVRIYPEYLIIATFAVDNEIPQVPTAVEGIIAGENKAIIAEGTVDNIPETTNPQGTVKYFVTLNGDMTAEEALAANGWTSTLPNAASYTGDYAEDFKVYVWYYIQAVEGYANSKPQRIDITLQRNLFNLTFKAANANTIEDGKATVTVGGTAATVINDTLKAVKMGSEVKLNAKEGYKFRKVEVKKAEAKLPKYADVVKICDINPDGNYLISSFFDGTDANFTTITKEEAIALAEYLGGGNIRVVYEEYEFYGDRYVRSTNAAGKDSGATLTTANYSTVPLYYVPAGN